VIIETYDDLKKYVQMYVDANAELVVIESEGGLGKSVLVEDTMTSNNKPYLLLNSHLTPLMLYLMVYKYRHIPHIILDDIETLLQNKQNVSLIKQLTETSRDGIKKIGWYSTTEKLGDVPTHFETESKVLILANDIKFVDKKVGRAVLSRGFMIHFKPSNKELLDKIREFCTDMDIVQFLEENCKHSDSFSLRSAVKGMSLKKQFPQEWKHELAKDLEINPELIKVSMLMETYPDDKSRVENYDKSRRTFYRHKKKLVS